MLESARAGTWPLLRSWTAMSCRGPMSLRVDDSDELDVVIRCECGREYWHQDGECPACGCEPGDAPTMTPAESMREYLADCRAMDY